MFGIKNNKLETRYSLPADMLIGFHEALRHETTCHFSLVPIYLLNIA